MLSSMTLNFSRQKSICWINSLQFLSCMPSTANFLALASIKKHLIEKIQVMDVASFLATKWIYRILRYLGSQRNQKSNLHSKELAKTFWRIFSLKEQPGGKWHRLCSTTKKRWWRFLILTPTSNKFEIYHC